MGNDDRGHSALPKLYGAPAYARPPIVPVKPVERPFDPDDLPLEAERARAADDLADPVVAWQREGAPRPVAGQDGDAQMSPTPARPLRLRSLGGRFRRDRSARA